MIHPSRNNFNDRMRPRERVLPFALQYFWRLLATLWPTHLRRQAERKSQYDRLLIRAKLRLQRIAPEDHGQFFDSLNRAHQALRRRGAGRRRQHVS